MTSIAISAKQGPDRRRWGSSWTTLLLLAPAGLILIAFVVGPLVLVLHDSFTVANYDGSAGSQLTLSNYSQIFQSAYIGVFTHSLLVAAENTAICVFVGYCVAYTIVTRPAKWQPWLLLLMMVPFWTDFVVRTFTWVNLLSNNGAIEGVLHAVGIGGNLNLIPSNFAVFMGLLYAFLPTAVLPIYATLRSADLTLVQAAEDLGCSELGVHRRVVLPMATTGLLASALLIFVPTMGVYVTTVLLGGGKQLLIGNLLETVYLEFRDIPFGAAMSIVMVIFMVATLALGGYVSRRARRRTA